MAVAQELSVVRMLPRAGEHGRWTATLIQRAARVAPEYGDRRESDRYRGCLTRRRYGFTVFQPSGNFSAASLSETAGTMITFPPSFQFAGVATLCFAVSCRESTARRISARAHGIGDDELDFACRAR
jgi:hypothetical protein